MGKHSYTIITHLFFFFFTSRRILKNRVVYKVPIQSELNHPLRIAESGRKEHISEPKQAIRKYTLHLFSNIIIHLF